MAFLRKNQLYSVRYGTGLFLVPVHQGFVPQEVQVAIPRSLLGIALPPPPIFGSGGTCWSGLVCLPYIVCRGEPTYGLAFFHAFLRSAQPHGHFEGARS